MSQLTEHFFTQLESYRNTHNRVVLGLSGGVDSRVLLELMRLYQEWDKHFTFEAVHVHHGLSELADTWRDWCEQWCQSASIAFHCETVTLNPQPRQSLEKLARDARYQALRKHMNPQTILLTGHHADDQMETLLLALKRGSGPKGLAAMAAKGRFGTGLLVRPLLENSRSEIVAFARDSGLEWVEDDSNTDTRFDRNFLRHQVAPVLKQRWPTIASQMVRSAALCAEQDALLTQMMAPIYTQCVKGDALCLSALARLNPPQRRQVVRMWFDANQQLMPSQSQLEQMLAQWLTAGSDKEPNFVVGQTQVHRYRERVYLISDMPKPIAWQSPILLNSWLRLPQDQGQIGVFDINHLPKIDDSDWVGEVSLSEPNEMRITYQSAGLKAKPEGRQGSRPMKKLWHEYSIAPWRRQRMPILLSGNNVVSVAGLFVDQQFSGTNQKVIWKRVC